MQHRFLGGEISAYFCFIFYFFTLRGVGGGGVIFFDGRFSCFFFFFFCLGRGWLVFGGGVLVWLWGGWGGVFGGLFFSGDWVGEGVGGSWWGGGWFGGGGGGRVFGGWGGFFG